MTRRKPGGPPLKWDFDGVQLSARAITALASLGAQCVSDARRLSPSKLRRVKNCGRGTVLEIEAAIGGFVPSDMERAPNACVHCGRPTPYRLVTPSGVHTCCGRLRCEVKLRDGVDLPESTRARGMTIEVRELRIALSDAVTAHPRCVYGPKCEDCWVCRAKGLLDRTTP